MEMEKIKSFKVYTDESSVCNHGIQERTLVATDIDDVLEILENNGYIVEVEYEDE